MKKYTTKAITPIWAHRIEVEQKENSLLITGWGHTPVPLSPLEVPPNLRSKVNLLQRLRGYGLRHLGQRLEHNGVYQFADAIDDEKLIAFVREFGPVAGEFCGFESLTRWDIRVLESLETLRREHRIFRALVGLVQQVNRGGRADVSALRNLLNTLRSEVLTPEILALEEIAQTSPNAAKAGHLIAMAHQALCIFFNLYRPRLFPIDGEVIELPTVDFTGIRDALYFQLRLDYRGQRTIETCSNCGAHFPVFKAGTDGCTESCRRAIRNRKYWNKNRANINAGRREK